MKYEFEIYSPLLDSVRDLNNKMTKSMHDFGADVDFRAGFRVGSVTVEVPEGKTVKELKKLLEETMRKKVSDVWLKEVGYVKEKQS